MKVRLKYQLCGLVSITALAAVAVLTLATWFYIYDLVFELRASRLEVVASLKAKELSQSLLAYVFTAKALSTRISIVNSLSLPRDRPNFNSNWTSTRNSLSNLLVNYDTVWYVSVQDRGLENRYLNLSTTIGYEKLPGSVDTSTPILDALNAVTAYSLPDGAPDELKSLIPGEDGNVPNRIRPSEITDDGLFLGPLRVNKTYIGSLTLPVYNNTTIVTAARNVLGFMTVVFDLRGLMEIVTDTQGLGSTGQVLVIGPGNRYNRWDNSSGKFHVDYGTENFKYILPPSRAPHLALRSDPISLFSVLREGWGSLGANGVVMNTKDPEGNDVAVGYAQVQFFPTNSSLLVLVEQRRQEAFQPIARLRRIVIGSVFGMFGLILVLTYPLAHFSVRPINRLHEATKLCGRPPEYREQPKRRRWPWPFTREKPGNQYGADDNVSVASSHNSSGRREAFRIPQKVLMGKHFIKDELTDLSATFNDMTDELLAQYENLESKVRQRTEELEQQKGLAEAANEAKTMFIANVSHELRTPLNGILGMCSLVLEENTLPPRSRENLEVVFKSGELLLHLLNDLLTFSKNQVWGAQVKLDPMPFRIRDFMAQIVALFGSQAKEKNIDLTHEVVPAHGSDWVLIGDMNRILQVVINLINNSLKFTPERGSVQLMIVVEENPESSNITPYTDITEKTDYITSSNYKSESSPATTPPVVTPPQANHQPSRSPSQTKPVRPPLFTRQSASTGIVNPESDITKSLHTRFKRFLSPNSPVTARSATASPSSDASTPYFVEFRVIDTGPGVPEHMKTKIFEPFCQGDAGLSRKYGGTGLGLSICQQLARLMGGEIHLKSFEGAGSTFTLRIPLQSAPPNVEPPSVSGTGVGDPSLRQRSVHTTTKSISILSSVREGQVPSGQESGGNMRLVGLSQPFFVPSKADEDPEDTKPPSPPPLAVDNDSTVRERPQLQKGETFGSEKPPSTIVPDLPTALPSPTISPPTPPTPQHIAQAIASPSSTPKEPQRLQAQSQAQQSPPPSPQPGSSSKHPKVRILIAEDNKVNQQVLVKLLQLEGVTDVTVAEDGQEAIDHVREQVDVGRRFDIIFMDIQMPNVDGHQSSRAIRELGYKGPIIALTAFADESNVKKCFESGMDCFLAKPVKRSQIHQMLRLYSPGGRGGDEKKKE